MKIRNLLSISFDMTAPIIVFTITQLVSPKYTGSYTRLIRRKNTAFSDIV